MQILYCDDCGIRIEDDSGGGGGQEKPYCPKCAPKHAVATAGRGPVSQKRSTRMTASRTGATSTPRVSPTDRTPTPGKPRTNAPNVPAAEPEELEPMDPADAAREISFELTPPWKIWILNNKPLAIAAGAGVVIIIVGLMWMLFGSRKTPTAKNTDANPTTPAKIDPKPPDTTAIDKQPPVPPKEVAKIDTPAPTAKVDFNPVLDMARRNLDGIKSDIAGGKTNPYEIRKRLEWFQGPQLSNTPMQAEALKLLETVKLELRPPDNAEGTAPGVEASLGFDKASELFDTPFTPVETRNVPLINFADAASLQKAFGRSTDIAIKFVGFIEVPKDGTYTFYINSDDGSMLYIGDTRVVINAGAHAMTEREAQIDLKAGKHAFRLEYYQGTGTAGLIFSWLVPGLKKEIVPAGALSSIRQK